MIANTLKYVNEISDIKGIVQSLEKYYNELEAKIKDPMDLSDLAKKGIGTANAYINYINKYKDKKIHGEDKKVKGCYVFIKEGKPFYVGISKHVFQRIQQHVKGKDTNSASLAYQLAKAQVNWEGAGKEFLNKNTPSFSSAKESLMKCQVAILPIPCDITLYMFEVYAAVILKTGHYNTFKTH